MRPQEEAALKVLSDHLKATGRGYWAKERELDAEDSSRPLPECIVRESTTGRLAAVEITTFDWPKDGHTVRTSMRRVLDEVAGKLRGSLEGTFALAVDSLRCESRECLRGTLARTPFTTWRK